MVFSTRDSAFEAPEEGESAAGLTSAEVRSTLDAIDFSVCPTPRPGTPATTPRGDDAGSPDAGPDPADDPTSAPARATWVASDATAPAPATPPAGSATPGEGDAIERDPATPATPEAVARSPLAAPPSATTAGAGGDRAPSTPDSPHLVVSPAIPEAKSPDPDAGSPPSPEEGGAPAVQAEAPPAAESAPQAEPHIMPPSPGPPPRASGPVVCELVDVVLVPRAADPLAFQPMSLTIRGSERLVLVVEDTDLRRQIFDCLGGLALPASGGVHLFGHDGGKLSPEERRSLRRGQIGLLHPELPLLSALTIEENLRLALELGADPQPAERLQLLMDRFDLHRCWNQFPLECPTDARLRAGLARALAPRPLCLVADMVDGANETDRTLALAALGAGLESARTTAILMLPLNEIPDWVDRAIQVSVAGMAELTRTDLSASGSEAVTDPSVVDEPEGADTDPAADADPDLELEEAA